MCLCTKYVGVEVMYLCTECVSVKWYFLLIWAILDLSIMKFVKETLSGGTHAA